jgi:hypothetical protein
MERKRKKLVLVLVFAVVLIASVGIVLLQNFGEEKLSSPITVSINKLAREIVDYEGKTVKTEGYPEYLEEEYFRIKNYGEKTSLSKILAIKHRLYQEKDHQGAAIKMLQIKGDYTSIMPLESVPRPDYQEPLVIQGKIVKSENNGYFLKLEKVINFNNFEEIKDYSEEDIVSSGEEELNGTKSTITIFSGGMDNIKIDDKFDNRFGRFSNNTLYFIPQEGYKKSPLKSFAVLIRSPGEGFRFYCRVSQTNVRITIKEFDGFGFITNTRSPPADQSFSRTLIRGKGYVIIE